MTEKQQTAVAWLKPLMLQLSCFITHEQLHLWNQAFEKALAMEREQRIEDMRTAFYKGVDAWMQNPDALESIFNELINK